MKLALIHDHLAQDGGAEKVLQALAEIYPSAPIYVLLYKKNYIEKYFSDREVKSSFIQNFPLGVKKYQWYMPLMPMAIESLDLRDFDFVFSSASSFAKGVITSSNTTHICYCHTTTRYLWDYAHQYIKELNINKAVKKIISLNLSRIRQWDRMAADRVDYFIANSQATKKRIKKYYGRESVVIYPPVDTEKFIVSRDIGNYFLAGGRFTPYKRLDTAIMAFNKLNIPLKIFGQGPDESRLRKMSKDNIEFLGRVSDREKIKLMSHCRAFIHPQEEDFGIAAVEAMAAGRPVIAYNKGGAKETIIYGWSGILFNEQNWEELADAVLRFLHHGAEFNSYLIKEHAEQFGRNRFKNEIRQFINKIINDR